LARALTKKPTREKGVKGVVKGFTQGKVDEDTLLIKASAAKNDLSEVDVNRKDLPINHTERIITDPEIMGGKPVIKGTRIPVALILERLAENINTKLLFEDYPRLTLEDIKACLWYAYELVKAKRSIT